MGTGTLSGHARTMSPSDKYWLYVSLSSSGMSSEAGLRGSFTTAGRFSATPAGNPACPKRDFQRAINSWPATRNVPTRHPLSVAAAGSVRPGIAPAAAVGFAHGTGRAFALLRDARAAPRSDYAQSVLRSMYFRVADGHALLVISGVAVIMCLALLEPGRVYAHELAGCTNPGTPNCAARWIMCAGAAAGHGM